MVLTARATVRRRTLTPSFLELKSYGFREALVGLLLKSQLAILDDIALKEHLFSKRLVQLFDVQRVERHRLHPIYVRLVAADPARLCVIQEVLNVLAFHIDGRAR